MIFWYAPCDNNGNRESPRGQGPVRFHNLFIVTGPDPSFGGPGVTGLLPRGVHSGSTVYMFREGFISERILAVVLAELPAENTPAF